ncbi:MAG: hypothetical protein HC941_04820 [Microcoleus sp. SU_5_3]|nr:hypothetical protein [Microcoleus sp. SU_5_3]
MQLEDYFNFWASDDIRLKGTRVGIEYQDQIVHLPHTYVLGIDINN